MSTLPRLLSAIALALLALATFPPTGLGAQPAEAKKAKKGGAARAEARWVTPPVVADNLQQGIFESKAAGSKVSYLIYLPPAYAQSPDMRFPVTYWLHGIGGSQQGVPDFCARLTAAIALEKSPPMIVVFVNGMVDSFYCDALTIRRPVETVIVRELIPHIDHTYRTRATREGRMIEGFSMGGFGAAHLGFKYPELFCAVSMIDAALLDLSAMKGRHADIFQRVFAGSDENYAGEHPLTLAGKNAAQIAGRTLIRQAVGALVGPNVTLHEKLTALGIAHDYDQFDGAGHNLATIYTRLGDRNWDFYRRAFAPAARP